MKYTFLNKKLAKRVPQYQMNVQGIRTHPCGLKEHFINNCWHRLG